VAGNAVKLSVADVERALAQHKGYTALLFTSANCPTCPAAARKLAQVAASGAVKALVVDADASAELVDYAGIMATPTLQLFQGSELLKVATGNRVVRTLEELC
jgi:thiol-disulfide isomerase/thioredoxin